MNNNTKIGIQFGLVAFVYYSIATWIKYQYLSDNLFLFSLSSAIIFFIFVGLWILAIRAATNGENASMDIKDMYRTIFIVIILGELGFSIINYLYPFHIAPEFFQEYYERNKIWMAQNSRWPQERQDETLASILNQKSVTWKQIVQGIGTSIIFDSIIAFIIVIITKKIRTASNNVTLGNHQSQ